jgi:hypothetical protein
MEGVTYSLIVLSILAVEWTSHYTRRLLTNEMVEVSERSICLYKMTKHYPLKAMVHISAQVNGWPIL